MDESIVVDETTGRWQRMLWIVIGLYFAGWLWSGLFFRGDVPGIYWLNLVWSQSTRFVIGGMFLSGVLLMLFGWARKREAQPIEGLINAALMLVIISLPLLFIVAFSFTSPWIHQDSTQVGNRMYRLATRSDFTERHDVVFRCDRLGMLCKQITFEDGQCTPFGLWVGTEVSIPVADDANLENAVCVSTYGDSVILTQ